MSSWTSNTVDANGITLHYWRTGGDKPAIVLCHGITDNGLCWTRAARVLEARFDVIMLDAFRGVFVPYHLKTKEAYASCLAKLTPGGVVVANLHNLTRMYPHDRQTLAASFPHRYSFVSESGNQTTFVAGVSERRVSTYEMRANARAVSDRFDFDVLGLCARYYMRTDWDTEVSILTDDFDPAELESAAERHNTTCIAGCAYPAE